MNAMKRWSVDVFINEYDRETYAEARLRTDDVGVRLIAGGHARRHPDDPDVPEIGDEFAVARALRDLSQRLLGTAVDDVDDVARVDWS